MIADEQAAALHAAKLRALTRDRVGASARPDPFPAGAAVVDGTVGWALLGTAAAPHLGAALAWARRSGVETLHVIVDDAGVASLLARRARHLASAPTIWRVVGTALEAVEPAAIVAPAPPPDAPDLAATFLAAGLEIVPGDGTLLGEVLGLEVARITAGDDGPELGVGVGRFDREVGEMTHGTLDPAARVARVVEIVAGYRRPGAPPHPLNQLVPERWLRSALVTDPSRIGAATLRPVPSVDDRSNLLETSIATAIGTDLAGQPLVVTCSTGVDLDLVPAAADDRALHLPGARLILAVPARDALPLTRDLAARLAAPAEVVGIDGEWRIPWQP